MCEYGKPVDLWEVNLDAWSVWKGVNTQWRASGMGIIGLDYREVRQEFEEQGIPYTTRNKSKIKAMERMILENVNSSDK